MSINYLKLYGQKLIAQGYYIVPIAVGEKFPRGLKGWQNKRATIKDLKKWLKMGFTGVGIQARTCVGVDLDIYDPEILAIMLRATINIVGDSYHRIGQPPKILLPFRTDNPFKKVQSKFYIDPQGNRNKVEILGDGQQWVHSAIHPDTMEPYVWPIGVGLNGTSETGLVDVAIEQLLSIDVDQAHMIVEAFQEALPSNWIEESEYLKNNSPVMGAPIDFPTVDEAAEITQDQIDWMDDPVIPPGKTGGDDVPRDGDDFQHLKPKLGISMNKLKFNLKDIHADDYHIWLTTGMAIHHETDGSEEGLTLWDEWSSKANNYDPGVIRDKWTTFGSKDREQVTAGTILKRGRDARTAKNPLAEFLDRYVYVIRGDKVVDLDQSPATEPMEMKSFRNGTANIRLTIDVAAGTVKDPERTKPKTVPVHGLWLTDPARKTAVGMCYRPGAGRLVPTGYHDDVEVNTFHMKTHIEGHGADLTLFLDHMHYLFGEWDQWFLDWMAFSIQRPEVRSKVTPLHISIDHGTGRGWIIELLYALVGWWNCSKTRMATISADGGYNEYMDGSLFCFIEEVHEGDKRFAISDKVRDMLTEKYFEVNIKYGNKGTVEVFVNFFWNSNHTDALVLKGNDRRIAVFRCDGEFKNKAYTDALYEWSGDARNIGRLFWWLMARDVLEFDWTRAPDTEAKRSMIGFNKTSVEEAFHDFLEDHPEIIYVTIELLMEALNKGRKFGTEFGVKDEKQVIKIIQQMGGVSGRHRLNGGNPVRFWALKHSQNGSDVIHGQLDKLAQAGLKLLEDMLRDGNQFDDCATVSPVPPELGESWMD